MAVSAMLLVIHPGTFAEAKDTIASNGAPSSFLLVGEVTPGDADPVGCDKALIAFHAELDAAHVANRLLSHPSVATLRESLLQFDASRGDVRRAIIVCGMGATNGESAFLLGSDSMPGDDLGVSAVSVRALSRISGKNGTVVLDLHPADHATPASLEQATKAWSHDTDVPGSNFASVEPGSGPSSLVERLTASNATSVDAVVQALGEPSRAAAPPPTAPDAGIRQGGSGPPPAGSAPPSPPEPAPDAATKPPDHPDGSPTSTAPGDEDAVPDAARDAGHSSQPEDAAQSSRTRKPAPRATRRANPEIRRLQVALLAHGAYHGRINGLMSNDLYDAIRRFQAQSGHPPTGRLTPDELKLLSGG